MPLCDTGLITTATTISPADTQTVGKRALKGAMLLTGSTYAAVLLGIIARKILSIILTPEQFGHIATALSFVDLIFAFSAFSFASAIINVRDNLVARPLAHLRENVFILTAGMALLASFAAIAIALIFPPEGATIVFIALVSVYAVQRVVGSFDTFYTQILERELDYKRISLISFIVSALLHTIAVLLAWGGSHAYSIPIATLVSSIVSMLMHRYYIELSQNAVKPKPWRYFNRETVRWLWSFGAKVMGNRLFESWLFRVDNLLVFSLMSYTMLGYYSQAFMIAQMSATAFAPIVSRVSIATYAEIQHDRRKLEEAFAITNFFLVRLLIPAAIFYYIAAPDLIRLFLSSQWYRSAAPLAALAGFVLITPLFENAKMLLGARLRLMEITVIRAAQVGLLVALIYILSAYKLTGIGLAVSLVTVIGYAALMTVVKKEVALRGVTVFLVPLIIGLVIAVSAVSFDQLILQTELPAGYDISVALQRVFIFGPLLILLQFALEYLFNRRVLTEYIQAVRARF